MAAYEAVQGFDIVHDHTIVGPFLVERWPDLSVVTTIHDESEMAEAIGRVSELDRATCRASVKGYFSTNRMATEHVALFESILAARRR